MKGKRRLRWRRGGVDRLGGSEGEVRTEGRGRHRVGVGWNRLRGRRRGGEMIGGWFRWGQGRLSHRYSRRSAQSRKWVDEERALGQV
jgi:hypothetical protein